MFEKFPGVVSVPAGEEVSVVTLGPPAPPVIGEDGLADGRVGVEPGQKLQGPPVTHVGIGLAVRPQDLGLQQLRSAQVMGDREVDFGGIFFRSFMFFSCINQLKW